MAKSKTVYVCDKCGNDSPKWEGRCPYCGEWNTLFEHKTNAFRTPMNRVIGTSSIPSIELSQISPESLTRINLSSPELDRVLGGGMVPGSVILVAGDPGIGKSTLVLRMLADVAEIMGPCLYVTGEESIAQVKMRADRIQVVGKGIHILQTTLLSQVLEDLNKIKPSMVVIDSIQTLYDDSSSSTAGAVVQIRECTRFLMDWVKQNDVPMVLIGHVTKGGDIAGPRSLEHMVDVVLYLEGDPVSSWRLLRSIKNRFGSTNEVGVFEMLDHGLSDVHDPSMAFLSERKQGSTGSVIVSTMEGSRPLLVEVQALTNLSALPSPRRIATGVDLNRLLMVCAVLSRRVGMSLANQDVLVNVTGGLKVMEPAADLGIALAIASCLKNVPVRSGLMAVGEIGLSGEIRGVPQVQRRISEAMRLGLADSIVPSNVFGTSDTTNGLRFIPIDTLREAVSESLGEAPR